MRAVCPAEVRAALPERVGVPDGLVIELPDAALAWLAAHLDRELLLEARLVDARAQCPLVATEVTS